MPQMGYDDYLSAGMDDRYDPYLSYINTAEDIHAYYDYNSTGVQFDQNDDYTRTYYVHPYTTNVYQYPYNGGVVTVSVEPKEKAPVDTEEEPDDELLDEFVRNLKKK